MASSKTIRVPLGTIRDGAARMASIADNLADCIDQMNNTASAIGGGAWIGKDEAAFVRANSSNQQKFRKTADTILQIADGLRSYADVMESTDREQASIIRSVG